ncbi:fibronectin type III domain-containing protein [Chroococcidiopsis sp.]|uniref:fibronectin type III domain-containing protein n=1 Tax=Chroococcidiopsis sp. TaxID=3088168 RepID=UPI003F3503CF
MSILPGTDYYIRVRAVTDTQESEYSDPLKITTPGSTVLPATGPAIDPIIYRTASSTTQLQLWVVDPIQEPDPWEYKISLSTVSDFSQLLYDQLTFQRQDNTSIAIENGVHYRVISVAGLSPGTTYYGKVTSSNAMSLSSPVLFTFTTKSDLPEPISIGVTNLTAITATANWIKVSGATTYRLDVADNSAFTNPVLSNIATGNVDNFDIPVLVEQTTYFYRVRSITGSTTSGNSNVVSFTTLDDIQTQPGLSSTIAAPVITQIRQIDTTQATVDWGAVPGATSYKIEASTSPTFTTIDRSITSLGTSATLDTLVPGTAYYLRLQALSAAQGSAYVTSVLSTLTVSTTLAAPQLLAPVSRTSTGFTAVWIKRSYASSYRVQLSDTTTFSTVLVEQYVGDVDQLRFEDLTPNTGYFVRVMGLNAVLRSLPSLPLSASTTADLPAPIALTPSEITASSIRLNLSLNGIFSDYLLSISKAQDSTYLGNGFYAERSIGYVSSYRVDLFLEPGQTYNYTLTGITSTGDRKTSSVYSFSTRSAPPVLSFAGDGRSIAWVGSCNRIEVSTDRDFKFLLPGHAPQTIDSTANQYSIDYLLNLPEGVYIRGYFVENGTTSEKSNRLDTCGSSVLMIYPMVTSTSAKLRWTQSKLTNYKLKLQKQVAGQAQSVPGYAFPRDIGSNQSILVENLEPGTVYIAQLSALSAAGQYVSVPPMSFRTQRYDTVQAAVFEGTLIVPSVPAPTLLHDRITLTLPATYSEYGIEYSRRSDFLVSSYLETGSGVQSIPNLDPNTTYYVRVYGLSSNKRSNPSTLTAKTASLSAPAATLIGTPVITGTTPLNEHEALLQWSGVAGATGYYIEVSESSTFPLLNTDYQVSFLSGTKAIVSGLVGTKTYYVRIYGFNGNSVSQYSSTVIVDTVP